MPFPLPSTHPISTCRIMQYLVAEGNLMVLSSKVRMRSHFIPRPISYRSRLYSLPCIIWPVKTSITPALLGSGDMVVSNTNMVSDLWTLPFSSSSLNFYRICPEAIHFGYLIIYCLQSYLKLYMLCICLKVLWEIIKIRKAQDIEYIHLSDAIIICYVFSFYCILFI